MTISTITYRVPEPDELGLTEATNGWCIGPEDPRRPGIVPRPTIFEGDQGWYIDDDLSPRGRASSRAEALIIYAVTTDQRHAVYVPTWRQMGFGVIRGYHGEATSLGVLDEDGECFDAVEGLGPTFTSTSPWTPLHDLDSMEARWFVAVLLALQANL